MGRYAVCSAAWCDHAFKSVSGGWKRLGENASGGQGKGVQGQQRLHKECEASLAHWGTQSQTDTYTKRM